MILPKIGDNIYNYEIAIDFLKNRVVANTNQCKLLGINDNYIVLNDSNFTVLDIKKAEFNTHSVFNKTNCYHFKLRELEDKIISNISTTSNNKNAVFNRMKKDIEKYINKKFGKYCGGIELLNTLKFEEEE